MVIFSQYEFGKTKFNEVEGKNEKRKKKVKNDFLFTFILFSIKYSKHLLFIPFVKDKKKKKFY